MMKKNAMQQLTRPQEVFKMKGARSLLPLLTAAVISLMQQVHAETVTLDCKVEGGSNVTSLHIDADAGVIKENDGSGYLLVTTPDTYSGRRDMINDEREVVGYTGITIDRHTGAMERITYVYAIEGSLRRNARCEKRREQAVPRF